MSKNNLAEKPDNTLSIKELSIKFSDLNIEQLTKWLVHHQQPSFRAKQLYHWFYRKNMRDFSNMTDIGKKNQQLFADMLHLGTINIIKTTKSSDGSIKILQEVAKKQLIETVLMQHNKYSTLCLSSQVGCSLGCKFCLTGLMGFQHNLSSGEIVDQILNMYTFSNTMPRNIVFMGMGEPFLNYDNVKTAINIITDKNGLNFGGYRITISTAGILPVLVKFFDEPDLKVNLAFSLNGTDDEDRKKLMPITGKYKLSDILSLMRDKSHQRPPILMEYVLIKDLNDSLEKAKKLTAILQDINCKVNLIPYNENPILPFKRPALNHIYRFQKILLDAGLRATQRHSKGCDIQAACGQLATTIKKKPSLSKLTAPPLPVLSKREQLKTISKPN